MKITFNIQTEPGPDDLNKEKCSWTVWGSDGNRKELMNRVKKAIKDLIDNNERINSNIDRGMRKRTNSSK